MLVSLPSLSNIAENNMARQIRKKSGTGVYHVMGRFWMLTRMDVNLLVTVMLRHSFR